ncbi:MAG: hypothetical protein KGP35_05710 [Bacteroidetes bacterium]|nr:hypothetical protein [Bacteroidota bacterium]
MLLLKLYAQPEKDLSNLRYKKISVSKVPVKIDSFSIIPGSIVIPGVPADWYRLDWVNGKLNWLTLPSFDSMSITYRVFPYSFNAPFRRMDYEAVKYNFMTRPIEMESDQSDSRALFDFGKIKYNGSFGRGISFGNNQDAVVNGLLNLQINGMLGDSMELSAALTDNNLPIQAEGNTQQLNEFDQVWIQLKKKGWQLQLGDIDIRKNDAYYMSFFKRLQGVAYQTKNKVSAKGMNDFQISGAIAKGKFTRYVFQGIERNQGPYRLQGPNGELFFIVLAGTERVFIDGVLMQRGEDRDYVINYNTAEITFTPRRMINKDRRIQVEFEFADRNYLNAQLLLSNTLQINPRLTVRVSAFSNSDVKSSPINQQLTPEQKIFLSKAGDLRTGSVFSSVTRDSFDVSRILYRMTDSTVNGILYDSVLVYSPLPTGNLYSAGFMDMGEGNGDYIQDISGVNGRIFKWVAPVNGIKSGRFAPVVQLIAPRLQQVVVAGADYQLNKNLLINAEMAMSRYDPNTFSSIDNNKNNGWAGRVKWVYENPQRRNSQALQWRLGGSFEKVTEQFRPVERLRPVEFTREWGLPILLQQESEQITDAFVELNKASSHRFKHTLQHYQRGALFTGWKNQLQHEWSQTGWSSYTQLNYSAMDSGLNRGYFFRPQVQLKKQFPALKGAEIGGEYYLEHNEIRYQPTDSISLNSFNWDTWTFFLRSAENANRWGFQFFTRRDKLPFSRSFESVDRSLNYNAYIDLLQNENRQLKLNATYRALQVYKNTGNQNADRALLGRVEYVFNEWNGGLTGNALYELGSGQEQRRDFSFLEVPAGQGEYTWNDYNGDGIAQVNEFEIAAFRDQARYIRVFTPTLDFIRANYNQFNYTIDIQPALMITQQKKSGITTFLSRLSVRSSWQLFKKEISGADFQLNPFTKINSDTALIALNNLMSNTLFFNRTSSKWGIELTHLRNTGTSIATYGVETRRVEELANQLRWNLSRKFSTVLKYKRGTNELITPKFGNRNYFIRMWSAEPALSFQKGTQSRLSLAYKLEVKNNEAGSAESVRIHALISEFRYNILSSSTINLRFQMSDIQFKNGNVNSPVAFIMLDALLPGRNFIWNLDITKRLANNMELSIQYDGRKPGIGNVIHTGRAGVRALF